MANHAKRAAARRHRHESRTNPTPPRDPALSAACQELQVLLDEEIERLSETLRAPFVYCCLENKSSAEAAKQLGLEEGTVRVRLSRARKVLQERLTQRGVSLTAVLAAATIGTNGASAASLSSLVIPTAQAATQIAAGQAVAAGTISTKVATLAEGVLNAMFLTKLRTGVVVLFAIALAGTGTGVLTYSRLAASLTGGASQITGLSTLPQAVLERPERAIEAGQEGRAIELEDGAITGADEKSGIDGEGFIQKWLVLAPIPFGAKEDASDAFKREQIKGEAGLKPKEGDKVKIGAKELIWQEKVAETHLLDFNAILGGETEDSVAYAISYIVAPTELKAIKMKTGSDDQCRVYINGKEVFKNEVSTEKDDNTTEVTLRKGTNIMVVKVVNAKLDWYFCVRFTEPDDRPITSLMAQTALPEE
jgi:hypothetical protein